MVAQMFHQLYMNMARSMFLNYFIWRLIDWLFFQVWQPYPIYTYTERDKQQRNLS